MKSLAFEAFFSRRPIVEKRPDSADSYNSQHQKRAQLTGN
jgi:hypothetical protein